MTARGSLAHMTRSEGPTDYPLQRRRVQAYTEQGVACIRLDELTDPWERQTVKNIADRVILGVRNGRR